MRLDQGERSSHPLEPSRSPRKIAPEPDHRWTMVALAPRVLRKTPDRFGLHGDLDGSPRPADNPCRRSFVAAHPFLISLEAECEASGLLWPPGWTEGSPPFRCPKSSGV